MIIITGILKFVSFIFHTIKGDSLWIMKRRGLTVGKNLFLGGAYIDLGLLHLITIGDNVTLAGGVTILAHDASTNNWLLLALATPVQVVAGWQRASLHTPGWDWPGRFRNQHLHQHN